MAIGHTPVFTVSGATGAITGPGGRALSCTVVDQSGHQSDKVVVVIDDRDAELMVPTGGYLAVSMGYKETGMTAMGTFVIDKVTLSGWPRKMIIEANGIDLGGPMKQQMNDVGHNMPLDQWVSILGQNGGVNSVRVASKYASIQNKFWPQTRESPMATLSDLANKYDAVAKVTNNSLVFLERGVGMSASGASLGTVVAEFPINVKDYEVEFNNRSDHMGGTEGNSYVTDNGEPKPSVAPAATSRSPLQGAAATLFGLAPNFADGEHEALEIAQAKATSLGRMKGKLWMSIIGNPNVFAQMTLSVVNVRSDVDGPWSITSVTHRIDNSGFDTTIEAEFPSSGLGGGGGYVPSP